MTSEPLDEQRPARAPAKPEAATPRRPVKSRRRFAVPVFSTAGATFLALLALLAAQMSAGRDPALSVSNPTGALVAKRTGGTPLRTRTSGGGATSATTVASTAQSGKSSAKKLHTRTSGGGRREHDD